MAAMRLGIVLPPVSRAMPFSNPGVEDTRAEVVVAAVVTATM